MKYLQRGFTTVYLEGQKIKQIVHAGNMGDTLQSVCENVDALMGTGIFDELQKTGKASGHPDYLYVLEMP